MIETRKWLMAKILPTVFGDRLHMDANHTIESKDDAELVNDLREAMERSGMTPNDVVALWHVLPRRPTPVRLLSNTEARPTRHPLEYFTNRNMRGVYAVMVTTALDCHHRTHRIDDYQTACADMAIYVAALGVFARLGEPGTVPSQTSDYYSLQSEILPAFV